MSPPSEAQRLLRRSKASERKLGHWLQEHDGPDVALIGIASSTGRVGHITNMQYDLASNSYAAENKNVIISKEFAKWWLQILSIAKQRNKHALLRIEPSNAGMRIPEMHIITAARHAELLAKEKVADDHT
jgi:hypothetical protein